MVTMTATATYQGTSVATTDDSIWTPCQAYEDMVKEWALLDALMGGTRRMRELGEKYLPRMAGEVKITDAEGRPFDPYQKRIESSFLLEAYKEGVGFVAARPFGKSPTYEGDELDERMQPILDNADGDGRSLADVLQAFLLDKIHRGVSYLWVDTPSDDAETRAEEDAAGIRPYIMHVAAINVIGWRHEGDTLVQLRIREYFDKPDGDYKTRRYEKVTAYDLKGGKVEWERWERPAGEGKGSMVDKGVIDLSYIPIVAGYTNRTGKMRGEPAMRNLGELNHSHWILQSDYDNCLRHVLCPLLFGNNITATEDDDPDSGSQVMVTGPNQIITGNGSPDASLGYVEHNGKAIESGRVKLDKLEDNMQTAGMAPFMQPAAAQTATGEEIAESRNQSRAQKWARDTEDEGEQAVDIAHELAGTETPEGFGIILEREFRILFRASTDLDSINKARERGDLSREQYWLELQRRGTLAEGFDAEAEKERLEDEESDKMNALPAALQQRAVTAPPFGGNGTGDEEEE